MSNSPILTLVVGGWDLALEQSRPGRMKLLKPCFIILVAVATKNLCR
jgi:hypothetical protein